ncbi:FhaA domain-containing protein [Thalassiella azotivora]
MGVIDKFERGIERAVNGAFAKAFRSEVQPVELASALRRETDNQAAVVSRGRTLVPNSFVITLSADDHARVADWEDSLADELADSLTTHARQQRYAFVGPVTIRFEQDDELDTGVYRVEGHRVKGAVAPAGTEAVATVSHPVIDVDGRRYQLTSRSTVLGRGSEADLLVDDPGVSRRHAEIRLEDGGAVIRDLGSTNGTYVDGERRDAARLVDGSTITMGRTRIRFSARADLDG